MYNCLTTYYTPHSVPVDISTGLIQSDYLDTLEKKLKGHTSKPNNASYASSCQADSGILCLSVPFLVVGGLFLTMNDLPTKIAGGVVLAFSVVGTYYGIKEGCDKTR